MSIASRISAMQEHLRDDYSVLELAGADLTNVDKNIVNLKATWQERLLYFMDNGTDVVWNNWDKVTGEGTSISLNNTLEAKMGIELKGNTYQYSTTGKNLFNESIMPTNTMNGIKWEYANNKIKISGTATSTYSQSSYTNISLSAGTYYFVKSGTTNLNFNAWFYNAGGTLIANSKLNNPFTISENATRLVIFVEGTTNGTSYNQEMNFMVSTTNGEYEPYTNGASPNPDYPQQVHTVSGDNEITICGKNLIDTIEYNRGINSSGVISGVDTHYLGISDYVSCKPSTTYTITFEHDISTLSLYIGYKDKDGNFINRVSSSSRTFTTPNNAYYMFVYVYKDDRFTTAGGYVQLEYGSTATPYEPYKEQKYPIYLGVENLWNTNKLKDGFVPASGAYPINNTSFPNAKYLLVYLYKGQSLTIANHTDTSQRGRIRYIDKDTNLVIDNVRVATNAYYTSNLEGADGFKNGTITAKKDFIVAFMTIDITDTKVNADVTYGTTPQTISDTPIEMCSIPNTDYNDGFIRNSGKNFFDINGTKSDFSASIYKYEYNLKPNTQYTISSNCPSSNTANIYANSTNSTQKVHINNPQTITSDSNGYFYILVRHAATSEDSGTFNVYQAISDGKYWLQIEEGNSATDYEPYGNGDWYLEKKVRHTSLAITNMDNSDEYPGWTNQTQLKNDYSGLNTNLGSATDYLCNLGIESNTFNIDSVLVNTRTSGIIMLNRNVFHLTQTQWKEQYPNLIFDLYYGLQTPTYTKIEGTLKDQLNALAKSYTGQTNISQENNDLASILNATALSE